MGKSLVLAMGSLIALTAQVPMGHTAEPPSRVPARLIPRGWEVMDEITGDLNRDGQPDLILQLVRKDEPEILEKNEDTHVPRRLIIALREGKGYRQVVSDDEVLASAAQSHAANGSTELTVERGNLVLTDSGGHGEKWEKVNRYRWSLESLSQIGFTTKVTGGYGSSDILHHKIFDVNLLTSQVEETRDKYQYRGDMARQVPGYPQRHRYRLLPVALARNIPVLLTIPLSSRSIKLSDRADLVLGGRRWAGASDLSADLSAALVGEGAQAALYVRALVRDRAGSDSGEVRLLDAKGALVRPESVRRIPISGGYAWQGRYSPATLKIRLGRMESENLNGPELPGWGVPYFSGPTLAPAFPATLEVISRKPSGEERLVLSTARSRKRPGLCWITTPVLSRLGVQSEHRFWYLPPGF